MEAPAQNPLQQPCSFETGFSLVLWYARCYSVSECFCEELYYVSGTGHSAPSLLFCLGCTDPVWCALFTPVPQRPLFPACRRSPPSVCINTHTRKAHYIYTHTQISISWSELSAVMEDGHVRLLSLTWSHTVSDYGRISIEVMKSSEAQMNSFTLNVNVDM